MRGAKGERWCRGAPAGALLLVLCLAVYLPGLASIPVVDRDEARFAQASRQMFESLALPEGERDTAPIVRTDSGHVLGGAHAGGVVVPMVQDRPRLKKPPMIYWLQGASAYVFTRGDPLRDAIWMYRVPSLIGAVIACLATWRLGLLLVDPRAALLGAALLAVCPIVVWEANQARSDLALLAMTTLAMWALTSIWVRRERAPAWAPALGLWLAIAAGVLVKGPLTPMVVGLSVLGLCLISGRGRWLARTKPVLGIVVLSVVVAPWVMAVGQRVGWETLGAVAFDETLGRSAAPKEGHWGPPGYHVVLLAALFWPGSMLTLVAFVRTWRLAVRLPEGDGGRLARVRQLPARWRGRVVGRDSEVLLLAWVVPSWIVFELISTKLPHYTLPIYPALALMSAAAVIDAARGAMDSASIQRLRLGLRVWAVIGLAICVGAPVAVSLLGGGWIALGAAVLGGGICAGLIWKSVGAVDDGFVLKAQAMGVLAAAVFALVFLGVALPRASRLWITERLVEAVKEQGFAEAPIASVGYHEDSLIFATRGRSQRLEPGGIPAWTRANPGGVLIAPAGTGVELMGAGWAVLDRVRGINYAGGRLENLEILGRER